MEQTFIFLSPEHVRSLLKEALRETIPEFLQPQVSRHDTLSFETALSFLHEAGYKISKARLYKLTSTKKIPFKKFGKKLIFSREELVAWTARNTLDPSDHSEELTLLAESAKRKLAPKK